LLGILLVVFVGMVHSGLSKPSPASRWMPWPAFLTYGAIFAAMLYRRWRARRDALSPQAFSQLRFSAQGFAQRDFLGPVHLHRWTPDLQVRIKIKPGAPNLLAPRRSASQRRFLIRILRWRGYLRLATVLVDFRLDCDQQVALQLQRRIEQCMLAAS
jgi:hypothetical protein